MWLWIVAALVAAIAIYVLWLRCWLKEKPWAQGFFAAIEPFEIALYKKSETILFARSKVLVGILLTLATQIGAIDLTPIMPFVPADWQPYVHFAVNLLPLTITVLGMIDEKLRNNTTLPVEIVAVPEAAPVPPQVAAAVTEAKIVKEQAVAVVQEAKKEGAV